MALVRWTPGREMERFKREVDKMFEDFFSGSRFPSLFRRAGEEGIGTFPAVDLYDAKDNIVVKAEIPGLKKEDIDIQVKGRDLIIKGEKKKEEEVKEEDYYYAERVYGSFSRVVHLPVDIKADRVKAKFKSGVLEVTLPKVEEAKPKEIKIEVED
jgi:HSP20 family protein